MIMMVLKTIIINMKVKPCVEMIVKTMKQCYII